METRSQIPFHEELRACLLAGTERLLRRKAALGENVVYAHPDGSLIEMPAAEALVLFREKNFPCEAGDAGSMNM
jgi:hypothetical protein